MTKNFYNLPPPWNPGYAIPRSVMDEGLNRQAFVTAMSPRGTYDDVRTGTAGYAVPQYVREERTGRGVFVTKWLPRGYYGPKVPNWLDQTFTKLVDSVTLPNGATERTLATMGDIEAGQGQQQNPWVRYGTRSAKAILNELRKYPPPSRPQVLKVILGAVDSALYAKVMAACEIAVGKGVAPQRALEVALSSSMTKGALNELDKIGRSRTIPQPNSLLGLGIYGSPGESWTAHGRGAGPYTSTGDTPSTDPSTTPSTLCPNPIPGFTWVAANGDIPGHWERLRARGPQITPVPYPGTMTYPDCIPQETDHRAEGMLQVGPFLFEDKNGATLRITPETTTPEITDAVIKALTKRALAILTLAAGSSTQGGNPGGTWQSIPLAKNPLLDMFGIQGGKATIPASVLGGTEPLFWFKHPTTGQKMAVKVHDVGNSSKPGYSVTITKWNDTWFGKLLDALTELVAKIIEVVKMVAEHLGEIVCEAIKSPAAVGAAAAATGGAAAAGAVIAGNALCKKDPPPPPVAKPSLLLPLAVGGAALLALVYVRKKKKK